jgi:uncharacterized protein (TIGR02996 family)
MAKKDGSENQDASQLDALHAALDADLTDALTRLAIADWYEEHGRGDEARAWRWMVEAERWPRYDADGEEWDWWLLGKNPRGGDDLPEGLFPFLAGANGSGYCSYASRREAEEALVEAFCSAVRNGWQPEPVIYQEEA